MPLMTCWKHGQCTDNASIMCFDTTSINTGHLSGACIQLQERLGKALLWSACRHHVFEVILSSVFHAMKIEVSSSPEVNLFTKFRDSWDFIESKSVPIFTMNNDDYICIHDAANTLKETTVIELETLDKKYLLRDDYNELMQLTKLYLSEREKQC